jgi:hypothetical protein
MTPTDPNTGVLLALGAIVAWGRARLAGSWQADYQILLCHAKCELRWRPTEPLMGARIVGKTTEHQPTQMTRAKVMGLACNAVGQERIAKHLGVAVKTLRKHYQEELDFGVEAVGAQAAGNLIRLMRGDGSAAFSACKYYLSCRMHWRERTAVSVKLELPELKTVGDAERALSVIFAAAACGKIPADDASTLSAVIEKFVKAAELGELEQRMLALEKSTVPMEQRFNA